MKFTQDKYDKIKALCDEHKITRKDRAAFEVVSHLRWMRHAEKIVCSDSEIIQVVNGELDWRNFEKGPNYTDVDDKYEF